MQTSEAEAPPLFFFSRVEKNKVAALLSRSVAHYRPAGRSLPTRWSLTTDPLFSEKTRQVPRDEETTLRPRPIPVLLTSGFPSLRLRTTVASRRCYGYK
ncbi:hypothetical protein EYF80_062983 [Liparis tanakae]|uniref:Uncharacterized protein n=1 Tax=Liparis tanakae TaxID=230148 RepID=A0A4Z2EDN8_9TELE|nr:hypothetical protein EYF80_062983 [Liparis tanakae]